MRFSKAAARAFHSAAARTSTSFHGKALAEDLQVLLDLASDGLRRPAFLPDYVERMRQQLLASLAIREQDTSEVASLIFDEALFPGHPYGKPVDGYIETIQAITRQDMVDFHARFFQPEDLILVIAGALEGLDVKKLVEDYFADWQNTARQRPALPAIPDAPKEIIRRHRFIEDKSQTDLILGTYGPHANRMITCRPIWATTSSGSSG